MENDIEYNVVCEICDSEFAIVVLNNDEKPVFCAMCGEEAASVTEV